MSLQNIPLRKLLKIMFLRAGHQISEIRKDIRADHARAEVASDNDGGGDFYVPFWADAKAYVFGQGNIHKMVDERIVKDWHRKRLYPLLRKGFLKWWNGQQNWQKPLRSGKPLKGRPEFPGLDAIIKIDNVLSLEDRNGNNWYIYPYFAEEPVLTAESARLGLWVLQKILPNNGQLEQIQILDVFRGRAFSVESTPLSGNEETLFLRRYEDLLKQRNELDK